MNVFTHVTQNVGDCCDSLAPLLCLHSLCPNFWELTFHFGDQPLAVDHVIVIARQAWLHLIMLVALVPINSLFFGSLSTSSIRQV
ncbi:hypothetical protein BJ508DRAFT_418247 [Ascobolus immersus RN42]|uniref:Uncharacterized protein n=1 Tax=Ascobolus immersus RN42 TaxID=1160509 RepID=A0A3N4HMZ2_ASCIM|nr:hypothetical protein BJ508DRAFT_418247 [Ascobolus immersus RN42]